MRHRTHRPVALHVLGIVAVVGFSVAASACVDADGDAECEFVPISGLAQRGESQSVTIEIIDGKWPQRPLGPGTEWAADTALPSWAPSNGELVGTATYGPAHDLAVNFGQGRVVTFPHVGCS